MEYVIYKRMCEMKFYCLDGCKWRCEFDVGDDVFCHLIGEDMTKEGLKILKLVGCSMRRPVEKKND